MRVELTAQQLRKASRLTPQGWRVLFAFLDKDKGLGEFKADMAELVEVGLVHREGNLVYAKFLIDGAKPLMQKFTTKKRQGPVSELYAFYHIWESHYRRAFKLEPSYAGHDISGAKKLIAMYSLEELTGMVHHWIVIMRKTDLWGLWSNHGSVRRAVKCEDDPYAFLDDKEE